MTTIRWYLILGIALLVMSVTVYLTQYLAFHNLRDTLFYMLQDLAFVPVQVLLVMLLLDKLLQKKEKEALLNKMNMMIGVFFNEVGTGLISFFVETEKNIHDLRKEMIISNAWNAKTFEAGKKHLSSYSPAIVLDPGVLRRMKEYLLLHRDDMLRMLENPNLLEHDKFTDLLWAVFHLTDELQHRTSFDSLPESDLNHLRGDAVRAFKLIVAEWLEYMKHLKANYPYLFSIAARTNPFNADARIEVAE
ncbi:MAG TPA: hypothetical protein PLM53_07960 [Spirochaetota bacterium]|nr:hypothetical protein [Spirochaetota bacterium]HPC42452.1 hypothetical protein [Spirochaetota bacterium]HPL15090.1 hypothetical protein [Spirochaetota bacterium]HQF08097.1 hypothetical protein [Spirochaetota bacterium]HQH97016.1 hypothetical protein [Spirochaetota bacterium]